MHINFVSSSCKDISLQIHSLLASFSSVPNGHFSKHKYPNTNLGGYSFSIIYCGIEGSKS